MSRSDDDGWMITFTGRQVWPLDPVADDITSPAALGRKSDRAARYEPIIVTTLRRYMRRGAPDSLLMRLAGGRGDWAVLNQVWDIDGTARLVPKGWRDRPRLALDDEGLSLGFAERRIALRQIVEECARRGLQCPRPDRLARYLGCTPRMVRDDLQVLVLSTDPAEKVPVVAASIAARVLA